MSQSAKAPLPRCSRILLQQIDLQDDTFKIRPTDDGYSHKSLRNSISRHGILHPPLLRLTPSGKYQIVWGRQRVRIASDDPDTNALLCLILPEEIAKQEALSMALEETKAVRSLSPAESAMALKKVLQWIDEEDAKQSFLPQLGIPPSSDSLHRYLAMVDLEEPLLFALHEGILHERVAGQMTSMSFKDRMSLFEVITALQLSQSDQKKLLEGCAELAAREEIAIYDLLSMQEVQDILNHPKSNPPQKSAALMEYLRKKLSPRLNQAEKIFKETMASLKLPKSTQLNHSPNFEGDDLTLSISFKNMKQFKETWPELVKILKDISS